jgi:hypothetical protein
MLEKKKREREREREETKKANLPGAELFDVEFVELLIDPYVCERKIKKKNRGREIKV